MLKSYRTYCVLLLTLPLLLLASCSNHLARPDEVVHVTDSGLGYVDVFPGFGDTIAEAGDTVSVHYILWLEDGTRVESSYDVEMPFVFEIGWSRVIAGFDEGVRGMKHGGRRRLIIPPELGYGESGAGLVIPPNATLVFQVDMIDIDSPGSMF